MQECALTVTFLSCDAEVKLMNSFLATYHEKLNKEAIDLH